MLTELIQERQVALFAVEADLERRGLLPIRLQPPELLPFAEKATDGWAIRWGFSDGIVRQLGILVDDGFPFTFPRIAVMSPHQPLLSWPHLEENGLLCILNAESTLNTDDPAGVVDRIRKRAIDLIENSIHGRNHKDFQAEFLSYWLLDVNWKGPIFRSIAELTPPSRIIKVWHGTRSILFAEDEEQGTRWLQHWGWRGRHPSPQLRSLRHIKSPKPKPLFRDALYCWLPEPPFPQQYPTNANELAKLLSSQAPDAYGMLCEMLTSGVRQLDILFGTETQDGKCAFSVSLQAPFDTSPIPGKRRVDRLQKGFRAGTVPLDIIAARFFSNAVPANRGWVERVDASWIHGRDNNPDLPLLRKLRVALIGCGALGSTVARALAQAGVGHLLLVDNDLLKWENLSRHQLGAGALKENIYKTAALKASLEQDFPHLLEVAERQVALGLGTETLWQELEGMDLVISLTGSWTAENLLNRYQQLNKNFPPVIYGWMEPHAAAGHAIAITTNFNGCLQCGFNQDGTPTIPVTDWPHNNQRIYTPACADPFSPYGATDLSWSQTLVSELALDVLLGRENSNVHHVWFGRRQSLASKGGAWNQKWIETYWDPGNGWFINQLPG